MSSGRVWKCYRCGKDVVPGMRFTFTRNGAIHWECFRLNVSEAFKGSIPEDVNVLMELVDYLNEGIIKLRELEMRALSDGVRESVINRRKLLEGEAARVMKDLESLLDSYGIKY
ncbi:MAG: DUF2175 domain-containing protein [Vulcanisaeta sp.]|nr:DUF2175 domain-containing protein [Vulcanisaeta sp.]